MNVDYGTFKTPEEFYDWVTSYHGSDVSAVCKAEIEKRTTASSEPLVAMNILHELLQPTREIDIAKLGLQAKFV